MFLVGFEPEDMYYSVEVREKTIGVFSVERFSREILSGNHILGWPIDLVKLRTLTEAEFTTFQAFEIPTLSKWYETKTNFVLYLKKNDE